MKTCFRCGAVKPLDEFYRHPQMGDGHLNKCKECTKADASERARRLRATDAEWLARERARCVAKQKRYNKVAGQKWPEKVRARRQVSNAVQQGKLTKPDRCQRCEVRKEPRQLQAHHQDYGRPLDVVFVCAGCHAAIEGRARAA